MNRKLIFSLSLFGLAMALATSFWLNVHNEMYVWPFIVIISAYFIAKNTTKYFANGIAIGLLNSIWINIAHVIFISSFVALNSDMGERMHQPLAGHVRLNLVIIGTCIGLASGIILGLLAWIISMFVKKPVANITEA